MKDKPTQVRILAYYAKPTKEPFIRIGGLVFTRKNLHWEASLIKEIKYKLVWMGRGTGGENIYDVYRNDECIASDVHRLKQAKQLCYADHFIMIRNLLRIK